MRAYNDQKSRWYGSAIQQKAGRIHAASMVKEVSFELGTDDAINSLIDEAYQAKYRNSSYLTPMIGDRAKAATIKVMPKGEMD